MDVNIHVMKATLNRNIKKKMKRETKKKTKGALAIQSGCQGRLCGQFSIFKHLSKQNVAPASAKCFNHFCRFLSLCYFF